MAALTQEKAASDLVRRARLGDQNAIAIINNVGLNARNGSAKAKSAYQWILDYIHSNPVKSPMGAEELNSIGILKGAAHNPLDVVLGALCDLPNSGNPDTIGTAIVTLANACPWNRQRISAVDNIFGNDSMSHSLWRFGYAFSADSTKLAPAAQQVGPKGVGIICAGHCLGSARKIQMARLKQVPLSVLGPQIGWEFGC